MNELVSAFNVLKKRFPNYEDRPQQLEMAGEVFGCLKDKKNLIVEAGTGVGKSFAYLIPAILSNKKTVVSTATIALQDQLVNNDLLFLQKALDHKFSFAILKGKNNYLCLKREGNLQNWENPIKSSVNGYLIQRQGIRTNSLLFLISGQGSAVIRMTAMLGNVHFSMTVFITGITGSFTKRYPCSQSLPPHL